MKKQIAIILAAVLAFSSFTGFKMADVSAPSVNAVAALDEKIDYDKMTGEDLVAMIKDPSNPTLEEYTWLLSTYQYVPIDEEKLEMEFKNITNDALKIVKEEVKAAGNKLPDSKDIFRKLIKSESPQVRAHALTYLSSLFGVGDEGIKVCTELMETETDPFVIKQLIATLANEGGRHPEIGAYFIEKSKSDITPIRRQAAYALANPWSKDIPGVVDEVIRLMNDEDPDTASYVRKNSGRLGDEAVIDPLVEILNDPAKGKGHGDCISGLVYLWFDYPFHEKTSEKAYKATIDYWKNTPRTEDTPFWTSFTHIKNYSEKNFDAWKEKATYFDVDEIIAIMKDIVMTPEASWLARTNSMDVIFTYATPEYCRDLKADIESLTDNKAGQLVQAYEKKIEKMEADLEKKK